MRWHRIRRGEIGNGNWKPGIIKSQSPDRTSFDCTTEPPRVLRELYPVQKWISIWRSFYDVVTAAIVHGVDAPCGRSSKGIPSLMSFPANFNICFLGPPHKFWCVRCYRTKKRIPE